MHGELLALEDRSEVAAGAGTDYNYEKVLFLKIFAIDLYTLTVAVDMEQAVHKLV